MSESTKSCPRCGAVSSGNFCASCGASLTSQTCHHCGKALSAGAAFCHHCGQPTSLGLGPGGPARPAAAGSTGEPLLPWLIAGLLAVIAIAGVVYALRGKGTPPPVSMANSGALPAMSGPAPDISNLTPVEQFARLNDRVMQAAQAGDTTTIFTFWPMALGAYQNLSDSERSVDARYHMATLYLMLTQYPEVDALIDTIMQSSPDNLLGYYLRGVMAEFQGDSATALAAQADFVNHYPAEIRKELSEYLDHRPILDDYYRAGGGK